MKITIKLVDKHRRELPGQSCQYNSSFESIPQDGDEFVVNDYWRSVIGDRGAGPSTVLMRVVGVRHGIDFEGRDKNDGAEAFVILYCQKVEEFSHAWAGA